ncbi:ribosome small subunit-dependent GTPase A [bacterium]|nr:ribosome small subunit-dependent GTPase A [bacterium]
MNLTELGWNSFFQKHFEEFKEEGFIPARIITIQKTTCQVYCEYGELSATVSGKFRYETNLESDLPAVGDWVVATILKDEGKAIIHRLLPRKSKFSRISADGKKPIDEGGGGAAEQVISANIDTVFLVSGLDQEYNLRRIERYLTLAYSSEVKPVIVLNKADVCQDIDGVILEVEKIAFGVPIHPVSAVKNEGIDQLTQYLQSGVTVSLLGSSGVGKSTIINSLLGIDRQEVNVVSESTGKGKHTTSYRELIILPGGGLIIDNPGMRELQLWADEDIIETAFEDVEALASQCRFRDCKHDTEPGCAIREAIENGELDPGRFESYMKQKKELRYLELKKDKKKAREVQKKFGKMVKQKLSQIPRYKNDPRTKKR